MGSSILLEDIQRLGFNSYEAKVYLALLERDSLSAAEVSQLSQVPRARVYDILDSLARDGLAILKPGKHKKYSAVEPELFRQRLISQNEKNSAELKKTIDRVTLTLKRRLESSGNSAGNRGDPLEYIEIIKEPFQMHKCFMQLMEGAEKEALVFSKPPYSGARDKLEEQAEGQAFPLQQGLSIKCIYEIPVGKKEIEWRYKVIEMVTKRGEKSRVIKDLPMKMAVFDEKIVLIALVDPIFGETSFTTQIIRHTDLAKGLKILFNTLWQQAEDYHVLEDLLKTMQ